MPKKKLPEVSPRCQAKRPMTTPANLKRAGISMQPKPPIVPMPFHNMHSYDAFHKRSTDITTFASNMDVRPQTSRQEPVEPNFGRTNSFTRTFGYGSGCQKYTQVILCIAVSLCDEEKTFYVYFFAGSSHVYIRRPWRFDVQKERL